MFLFFLLLTALSEQSGEQQDKEDEEEDDEDDDSESSKSKKDQEKEDEKLYWTDYIKKRIGKIEDTPARTKNAFVSVYSSDIQNSFGYLQMLIVLGFNLKTLCPSYDRVLVIWEKLAAEEQIMSILKKVWTHFAIRPYIKWPSNYTVTPQQQAHWFKYYIWTLPQYEKVCFLGADTLVFRDISNIFSITAPATGYDMENYSPFATGQRIQHDCMLITPSFNEFAQILELTVPVLNDPTREGESAGTYDTGVLQTYFKESITLLPIIYMHENRGFPKTILQDVKHPTEKVVSLAAHFGGDSKPWKKRMTIYSEVWMILAANVYEKLDVPFSAGQLGQQGEELVAILFGNAADLNRMKALAEAVHQEEEEEMLQDLFPAQIHSGTRRNITMLFLVLFVSLLMLKSTLGTTNPFNVFMSKIETKIDQFVRLDEEVPKHTPQRRIRSNIRQKGNEIAAIAPETKKKKHRKHKKTTNNDEASKTINQIQEIGESPEIANNQIESTIEITENSNDAAKTQGN